MASCGVRCRCGLDPTLLCLWCRPAPIEPLVWEPPLFRCDPTKKKKKKKKINLIFPTEIQIKNNPTSPTNCIQGKHHPNAPFSLRDSGNGPSTISCLWPRAVVALFQGKGPGSLAVGIAHEGAVKTCRPAWTYDSSSSGVHEHDPF